MTSRAGHQQSHSHGNRAADGDGHHSHTEAERYSARRHPEHVVLDIGRDVGALIIHTDPSMHGVEIEISAAAHDDAREHKEVLEREIDARPAFAAVFDKIREGSYTLWIDGVPVQRDVVVTGSSVSELDWTGRIRGREGSAIDRSGAAAGTAR